MKKSQSLVTNGGEGQEEFLALNSGPILSGAVSESSPTIKVTRPNDSLRKLLLDNPMQMETLRFRRRFLNVTQSPKVNQTLLALVCLIYAVIVGIVFTDRVDLPVVGVLILQQGVVVLSAVIAAHAAIAGERDRRSWELLQVAPITQYQIVFGKFRSVVNLIVGLQAAFLPFVIIGQIFSEHSPSFPSTVLLEALCFACSSFCAAATIFLSSKMKSANATLVSAISATVTAYGIFPLLATVVTEANNFINSRDLNVLLAYYHPIYYLALVTNPQYQWGRYAPGWGLIMVIAYLGFAIAFVYRAGHLLTNEHQPPVPFKKRISSFVRRARHRLNNLRNSH